MAVKIDIPGVGEVTAENAASERTLRDILKALGGKTPTGQQGGGGVGGGASKEASKASKEFAKNTRDASKEVEGFGSRLGSITGGLLNSLAAGIGAVVGAVPGLAKELAFGGQQLSDFTRHLPIPYLAELSGVLDQQVNSFRQLTQTGASFGNNMFEITRIAGQAAIPQQDFIELVSQQSESLRIFGSTVGDGARRFAGLSKELRQSPLGTRLQEIGFTSAELNENFINYSELMQTSGRRQFMTDKQLMDGSLKYSSELDKISKLTGKSRKSLEDEMKAKNLDIKRQMAINKHGEEFGLRLQQMAAASPELEAALLDMADGVANDPLTKQLMANNDTFRNQATNLQNMTAEQANNFVVGIAKDGMKFANTLGDAGVQAAEKAGGSTGQMLAVFGSLQKMQKTIDGSTTKEQAKRDAITAKMGTFAETVATVQGNIQAAIVDSGIFQDLSDTIADFMPTTEEAKKMYGEATEYFKTNILPGLKETYEWFTGEGYDKLKKSIGGMWDYAKDELYPKLKEGFKFLTDTFDKIKPKIQAFFAEGGTFDEMMKTFTKLYKTYAPQITEFFKLLFSKEGITNLYEAFKDKIIGAFEGLTEGIGWLALGGIITWKLVKALANLNPFVKVAGLIIGGLVAFIGWDNIKEAFSKGTLLKTIGEAFMKIVRGIGHIFSWDSLKGYIGNILPEGKIGDWARKKLGVGATPSGNDSVTTQSNPTVDMADGVANNAKTQALIANGVDPNITAKEDNGGEGGWLSNKLDGLIDVMKGNKKATEKLNGNINGR